MWHFTLKITFLRLTRLLNWDLIRKIWLLNPYLVKAEKTLWSDSKKSKKCFCDMVCRTHHCHLLFDWPQMTQCQSWCRNQENRRMQQHDRIHLIFSNYCYSLELPLSTFSCCNFLNIIWFSENRTMWSLINVISR